MEFFQKFDCGTRRTAVVTRLETKLDGKADLHVYGDGPNEWEDEHANNAATVMIGLACGKKK